MAQPELTMPLNLRARPQHGGLPVPFTTLIRNGVPDFRVNDPRKVRACARGWGKCYLKAGFREAGHTEGGLLALVMTPDAMPPATPPNGAQLSLMEVSA